MEKPGAAGPLTPVVAESLVAWWRLDEGEGREALDSVSGIRDAVANNFGQPEWRTGVSGSALVLDGYSTWVVRRAAEAPALGKAFTLEAWMALSTYPVNMAGIISRHRYEKGFMLALSKLGDWGLHAAIGGRWQVVWAPVRLPKERWVHLAVTFDEEDGVCLYMDGKVVGVFPNVKGALASPDDLDLVIGRNSLDITVARVFQTGVVHGLIDEVKIYNRVLSATEIEKAFKLCRPAAEPDFRVRPERFDRDMHRPRYHPIPPANWTNEPHGPIFWRGRCHIFYQANPNGPYWGQIHWGHSVSSDLVHWEHLPPALAPEPGPDQVGCWSGCTVTDGEVVTAIYTGEQLPHQVQNIAQSRDELLLRWEKHPANPVIPGPPAGFEIVSGFRDPWAWREGNLWYVIVGCGLAGIGGTVFSYRSQDLVNWEYRGPVYMGKASETGFFWEMPQFPAFGSKRVLIVNEWPGSKRGWYWVGSWENERFVPETPATLVDLGEHYLSPSVCTDDKGRMVAFGVIKETRGGADQLAAGWANLFGLPRIFTLRPDGLLGQEPAPELAVLRGAHRQFRSITVNGMTTSESEALGGLAGDSLELVAEFDPESRGQLGFKLRRSPDGQEETLLYYDSDARRMCVNKERASLNPHVERGVQGGPFALDPGEPLQLRIFIDHSVIEVFINGRATLTTRVYPTRPDSLGIDLFCRGGQARLRSLDVWEMQSI